MNHQAISNKVFNPRIINEHLALLGELEPHLQKSLFPFASSEFAGISWHLCIANIACACFFLNNEKEWLLKELTERIRQQDELVRVGDYVNAPADISKIRGPIGPTGWLLPIQNRKVPLRVITASVINFKLELFLSVFNAIERNGSPIEWRNYKDISDIYALSILTSYWGREADEQRDRQFVDSISEIIYENLYSIKGLIQGDQNQAADPAG